MKRTLMISAAALMILLGGCARQETNTETASTVLRTGIGVSTSVLSADIDQVYQNETLTRIKNDLNITLSYDWVCAEGNFAQMVNLCIASDTLPDVLEVEREQYEKMLENGQLQSLTDSYHTYASDRLNSFLDSSGAEVWEEVTVDGEIMAIPEPTLTASSINVMWIRKDWLDELGLDVPRTIEEVGAAAEAFVSSQPGGKNTIGILGPGEGWEMVSEGRCCFGFNPIFSAFHAYPKYWILDESGNLVYGSIQPEVKEALAQLQEWYRNGILDQEMFVRTDIENQLLQGNVGIFFGPWWCAEKLSDGITNGTANWQAYASPVDPDGRLICMMPQRINKYVVVRKDYEHPEAIIQLLNYCALGNKGAGIYLLGGECDYANELEYTFHVLKGVTGGIIQKSEIDFSSHKNLQSDLDAYKLLKKEPYDQFDLETWNLNPEDYGLNDGKLIRLYGIMSGAGALAENDYTPIYNLFSGQTASMKNTWEKLNALEEETFARIILGQQPVDSFDQFVEEWYREGGAQITQEVTEALANDAPSSSVTSQH